MMISNCQIIVPLLLPGPGFQSGPDPGVHDRVGGGRAGDEDEDHDQQDLGRRHRLPTARDPERTCRATADMARSWPAVSSFAGRVQPRVEIRKPQDADGAAGEKYQPADQKHGNDDVHCTAST